MSENKSNDSDPRAVIGVIAGIVCAFAGYDVGGWPGALVAAVAAFGGIYLLFAAIVLGIKLAICGGILLLMLLALKNRWEWLSSLLQ